MYFQSEIWKQYTACRKHAKRMVRIGAKKGKETALPTLESILDRDKVDKEVDLGTVSIPVDQIIGVVSDRDQECYAGDFLPIPKEDSEFAENWARLYMEHLSFRGLADPIVCYEYFGKFYVIDGKKRVSVLKANQAPTVEATVIRILPVLSEDRESLCYQEFLETYEKTGLYQINFSQPGKAREFLHALGYATDHVWSEMDRYHFMFNWHSFDIAFKSVFPNEVVITTADLIAALLKDQSYSKLIKLEPWTISDLMRQKLAGLKEAA